jgi:hypothetical protein
LCSFSIGKLERLNVNRINKKGFGTNVNEQKIDNKATKEEAGCQM